ncbi:LysR family transcriptional regulator [Xylophilus rhododendri]|uniref:LysR family transcriptional regulator n=1 Tax=Xylophilus rhododendri TaxID=2697032 RepID=A0A857J129_9BURK|nr:LysR family transcriptional regulator [Xylophilus rhododendri]QHI96791.1 LysR family transcriptional regulator [Xylophilus rhododendri]
MGKTSLDSLEDFAVFVQVAETRSFAQTARLGGVSASAVAKRMARLEERLKVRLLHRSTRSVTLTAEGAMFLARSRRVLDEVQGAELELSQASRTPRGRLRLSLPMVASLFLPQLAEFMRRHPAIDLHLDLSDRLVDVIEEGFDAVIRTGEHDSSGLTARRLGSWPMLLVASPAYLAARGRPQRPGDLAAHSCLHHCFTKTGKLEPWPLDWSADDPEIALPVTMVSNTLDARVCFAEQGLGIALLPEFSVREGLAAGRLQAVLPDFTVARETTFRIYWPSGRHASPKVRALVDFLVSTH